jgi:streptomycin 6-kinase
MPDDTLAHYVRHWNLREDGFPFASSSGIFQPVLLGEIKCMLKIARREKDRRANDLMVWWNGDGAAKILLHDHSVLLMERASNKSSLVDMAKNGRDDEASSILCRAIARLHSHQPPYPTNLIPLTSWFAELQPAAANYGGSFSECSRIADSLLQDQQDIVALHGDIHHGNVLDFDDRGWLAIDPKGLLGDRGFDYANIFCNPDPATALQPGRLLKQAAIIARSAGLDRTRLLHWTAAWAGLSAAWCISDGQDPHTPVQVANLATAILQP